MPPAPCGEPGSPVCEILDTYFAMSTDGVSWSATLASDLGPQPEYEMVGNRDTSFHGDYLWIDANGGSVYGVWTDNRDVVPGIDRDVDPTPSEALQANLYSPWFDLSAYKRARAIYDLWYYDDSTATPIQDYGEMGAESPRPLRDPLEVRFQDDPTNGWTTVTLGLTPLVTLTDRVRLAFLALDNSPDHIVEMGIDNVRVEGGWQVCDALGVTNPPSGNGDTLRGAKRAGELLWSWQASPVDGSHDGAAYYQVFESAVPDTGFVVVDTASATRSSRALDPVTAFYLVSAVNSAGTSGDEPTP